MNECPAKSHCSFGLFALYFETKFTYLEPFLFVIVEEYLLRYKLETYRIPRERQKELIPGDSISLHFYGHT